MRHPLLLTAALAVPAALTAQPAQTLPPHFTETEEIALARSAAPAAVSNNATVMVLRDGRYQVAETGTNGVTCIVSRSLPLSVEPICYDPEGSRTMLRVETRRVELRLAGVPIEELDGRIAEAVEAGELPLPERPALAYMLSAGQILYADAETKVGAFLPHLHFYWPYATEEMFGALGVGTGDAVIISGPGEPTASLIVFAKDFVEVERAESTPPEPLAPTSASYHPVTPLGSVSSPGGIP